MKASFFNVRRVFLIILIAILLITLVFDKPIQARAALPNVRVGLKENQQLVIFGVGSGEFSLMNLSGGVIEKSLKSGDLVKAEVIGELIRVYIKKAGGTWGEPKGAFIGPLKLVTSAEPSIVCIGEDVSKNKYRGQIEVRLNSGKKALNLINELPLEEYLYGVVPIEMSASWPIEALKAQAVAARTFAVKRINSKSSEGFDLYPDTRDQAYGGFSKEEEVKAGYKGIEYIEKVYNAINGTAGKVIYSSTGSLIDASYHSNSGGHTEDVENVWSDPKGPDSYRRGKPDEYSLKYQYGSWFYKTDFDTIKSKVGSTEDLEKIELRKLSSGRVSEVIITDIKGNTIKKQGSNQFLTGTEFGKLFNSNFNPKVNNFMSRFFDFNTNATISIVNGEGKVTTLHGGGNSLKVINGSNQITGINGTNTSYTILGGSSQKAIAKSPQGEVTIEGHGWGHGVGMSQWGAYGMATEGFKYDQILKFYYSGVKIQ